MFASLTEKSRQDLLPHHAGFLSPDQANEKTTVARGKAALRSVCHVMCGSKLGCGILVSSTRLLTHWRVFDLSGTASQVVGKRAAADSCVTFFYGEEGGTTSKCQIQLRPDEFFFGDSKMEFCLVGLGPPPKDVTLCHVPLSIQTARVEQGQGLAIVHKVRPDVQIDETHVLALAGSYLRYTGSLSAATGSPVFDDHWNIVALHLNEESINHWKRGLRIREVVETLENNAVCLDHFILGCPQCWFACRFCGGLRHTPATGHMETHVEELMAKVGGLETQIARLVDENKKVMELVIVETDVTLERASVPGKTFNFEWKAALGATIGDLKRFVNSIHRIPVGDMAVFMHGTKPLSDSMTLLQLEVANRSKLFVVATGPTETLSKVIVQLVGRETKIEYEAPLASSTVRELKEYLQQQGLCGDKQRAFFSGRVLDDRYTLEQCGIKSGSVVLVNG